MEITLTQLKAMAEISIRTQHSEYCFRLTDPTSGRGLLRGGRLGNQEWAALFSGVMPPRSCKRTRTLKVGTRALFYVTIHDRIRVVVTSLITQLSITANGRQSAEVC